MPLHLECARSHFKAQERVAKLCEGELTALGQGGRDEGRHLVVLWFETDVVQILRTGAIK